MGVLHWFRPLLGRVLVAGLAALTALPLAAPAAAGPGDDKARVDRELAAAAEDLTAANARAQQAARDYAVAVAELPGAQTAVAEAKGKVAAAEAAVRRAEREAAAARAEQAAADEVLADAGRQVEDARTGVARFASATYRGGGFVQIHALMSADSPNQFAERIGYLDKIAESRRSAVDVLVRARGQAREQRSVAAAASRRAREAADRATAALERSRAAAVAAQQAADRVQALVGRREAAVTVADQERSAVLASYNQLQAESAQIAAELQAADRRRAQGGAQGGGRLPVVSAGAYFTMPVNGHRSSSFGLRYHPLFHYWRLHAGMDIGAGNGSPIVAAADGEVVRAGWSGGYGNYTCVQHGRYEGRGIATCYGHQSQILVRPGQRVQRGQLIGRVGSTGASTGPHLHFEVRLDGTPVDPAKWLPG